jgi:hypothetical protein
MASAMLMTMTPWMWEEEQYMRSREHPQHLCCGNCSFHPLLTAELLPYARMEQSWGDLVEEELKAMLAKLTADEKAALKAAAEKLAEEAALKEEARKMAAYAHDQGIKMRCKNAKHFQQPCRNLYFREDAPKSQWVKNKRGDLCAPLSRCLTGSECWKWEYTDPVTKQRRVNHVCDRIHPGEVGWLKEWETDRLYKPPVRSPLGLAAGSNGYRDFRGLSQSGKPYTERSAW